MKLYNYIAGIFSKFPEIAIKIYNSIAEISSKTGAFILAGWENIKAWFNNWVIPNIWEPLSENAVIDSVKNIFTSLYDWIAEKFSKLNPFNWELPSWLGGKGATIQNSGEVAKNSTASKTTSNVTNNYAKAYGFTPHASGGILTQPHLGLVAEAGPEAIIPLSDKSKGIPILFKAAQILGLNQQDNFSDNRPSLINFLGGNDLEQQRFYRPVNQFFDSDSSHNFSVPNVNLTVNINGDTQNPQSLAQNISEAVQNVLEEIMSRNERVSFA